MINEELNKTILEIEKKVLYFCKLKGYNKGKFEINVCGDNLTIDYHTKERIK